MATAFKGVAVPRFQRYQETWAAAAVAVPPHVLLCCRCHTRTTQLGLLYSIGTTCSSLWLSSLRCLRHMSDNISTNRSACLV